MNKIRGARVQFWGRKSRKHILCLLCERMSPPDLCSEGCRGDKGTMSNQRFHAGVAREEEKELSLLTNGLAGKSCCGGMRHGHKEKTEFHKSNCSTSSRGIVMGSIGHAVRPVRPPALEMERVVAS